MDAQRWIAAFSSEIGEQAPDPEQFDQILKLAGIAAHASERVAAPVACYLAGRKGMSLADAIALAEELSSDSE